MLFRCIFSGNSARMPQQCSVFIAAGVCRIEDCQIISQSGGGIVVVVVVVVVVVLKTVILPARVVDVF